MKEIGEKLKMAREDIGVSIEEAAEDLKVRPSQIENIEAGNSEAFKDVFILKYLIRDYSKYLGLNKEDLMDEFNEYLFDYTSRLSLDDIEAAKKKNQEDNKIKSPYTIERKNNRTLILALIYVIIIGLIFLFTYIILNIGKDDSFIEGSVVSERK